MTQIRRLALPLILVGYLLLGVAYSMVTPLGEAPDEVDHVRYLQLVAERGELPVMREVPEANITMEANQPPLYYLASAGVWRLLTGANDSVAELDLVDFEFAPCFPLEPTDPGRKQFYLHSTMEAFPYAGDFAAFQAVRLLSLLMGAGTILVTHGLGRQIAPGEKRVALLAAALLAFNPQFLFITASVNNDNLTVLLGALIVYTSVLVAKKPGLWRVTMLALLLGLGALTKLALFALWPVAFLAVLLPAWREGGGIGPFLRRLLPPIIILLVVPALVAGWWYWRAQILYGDPLAWDVHLAAKWDSIVRLTPFTLSDLAAFGQAHFRSYWATFGWLNIQFPPPVYWLIAVMVLAAIAGLFLIGRDWLRNRTRSRNEGTPVEVDFPVDLTAVALNLIAIGMIYLSLFRYIQTINWSGYQGRLAYAVAASVGAMLAASLWRLGGRFLAWIAGGSITVLAVAGLSLILMPAFARPLIYLPETVDERPCVRMPNWQVEGAQIPEQILPGAALPIVLHGYGLAQDAQAELRLDLVGRGGEIVGEIEEQIVIKENKPFSVTVSLPVAADSLPARALLRLAAPADGGLLALTNARGLSLESPFPLAWVKIAPSTRVTASPQNASAAQFGEVIALLGYDEQVDGVDQVLTLYWQATAPMFADYVFFVHVLDSAGRQVGQWDGQPQGGAYPTSIWDVGEVVTEQVRLTLPEGELELVVGVYAPETGVRLPAFGPNGERQPDDRFSLEDAR